MAVTFLKPDEIEECNIGIYSFRINKKIIPNSLKAPRDVCSYIKKGDPMKPCKIMTGGKAKGICIHNTNDIVVSKGTNPAEQYCRATYNGHMSGAVVHFYVWHEEIWQLLDLNEQGWHAGDSGKISKTLDKLETINGNQQTIAIEIIGKDYASEKMGAILAAYLLDKIGYDHSNGLYYHKYFSGKNCPEYILPHWDDFVILIRTVLAGYEIFEKNTAVCITPCIVTSANQKKVIVKVGCSSYSIPIKYIRRI